jgi:hypothetical protein
MGLHPAGVQASAVPDEHHRVRQVNYIVAVGDVRDLQCLQDPARSQVLAAAAGGAVAASAVWVHGGVAAGRLLPCVYEDMRTTLPRWSVVDNRHCFAGVVATLTQVTAA